MTEDSALVPCPIGACEGYVFARHVGDSKALGCDGPSHHGDASIVGEWRAQDEREGAKHEFNQDERLRRIDPTAWAKDKLLEAQRDPEEYISIWDIESVTTLPKYPVGFVDTDARLPHLNGMVTLSGKASAGKSWFAIGAALNAAAEGWDVHYVAAEGADVITRRIQASRRDTTNFTMHIVEPGFTVAHLIQSIIEWIVRPRTLLVFDSITTLLGLMEVAPGMSKWDNQAALEMFLMRIRSLTRGWVAIINLSEANAAGETKGRSLDHRSDIAINFLSCEAEREVKTITVVKSWEGHTGSLGFARVDWQAPGLILSDVPPAESDPGDQQKSW